MRMRSALIVFLTVISVIVSIAFVRTISKASTPGRLGEYSRTAILRWRPQVMDLSRGVDLYRVHNYPNPPIMAILLRPLMELPTLGIVSVWFILKLTMAAAIVLIAIRLVRGEGPPLPVPAMIGAIALALPPILGDLSHGNVNLLIAFLVFVSLLLFHRRCNLSAGIVLALAIACKVTPALFLPYFVWKRAWRMVGGILLGLVLWTAFVPGALLGWDYNRTLHVSWFDTMVRPFVIDGQVTTLHSNQSLPGIVFRLLTNEPSFLSYGEDGSGPPEAADFHTIVDLSPPVAKKIVQFVMLLFGLAVILLGRAKTHEPDHPRSGTAVCAEWSLILLGMLLFSERTWKHHAVTLILPLLVLAVEAARATTRREFVIRAWPLILAGGLMFGQSALSERWQDLALVYGCHGLAYLTLSIGIVIVLLRSCRASMNRDSNRHGFSGFDGDPGPGGTPFSETGGGMGGPAGFGASRNSPRTFSITS